MLNAQGISVRIGRKQILHGVDFTAAPGAMTAIVGPNGSGKTTLLKALTGEYDYDGRVDIDGADLAALPPVHLAGLRGVLPQQTRLAFPFNVLEVVRMGQLSGVDADRPDLPLRALARVGLTGFETRFYHELSGGEQQRVQLARVLVQVWQPVRDGTPRWLFLDEPVSALDIGHQLQVMQIAADFAAGGGGVVAVMHDLNLTAMFARSVALMDGGHICIQGAPGRVLTNENLSRAYHCPVRINTAPLDAAVPYVLPQAAGQ